MINLNNNNNSIDKFRIINRKKILYDSLEDEEINDEISGFYIFPDSWYIKTFDFILLFISLFYSIFVPILLANNYFIKNKDSSILKYIFIIIDIFYLIDCFINFFKGYNNYYEHLIIERKKIIKHYFKTCFLLIFYKLYHFILLLSLIYLTLNMI